MATTAYWGSGRGAIAPDGCPVEFYARLPLMGEPEIVHAAVPAGASVLELGCGTGRLIRALAALEHPVHGVDESAEMLAYAGDLPTTQAAIEDVDLRRTFDVVLLASTLVNGPPPLRAAFLRACRRHVAPDGVVVLQQTAPGWFDSVTPGERVDVGIRRVLRSVQRFDDRVEVVNDYHLDGETWTHAFDRWRAPDLEGDLAAAGLRLDRRLTEDGVWVTAVPVAP
ncbi:methyltransferase family protein [Motilibacter rhizosphaerae]|uniref:Methyltransferase family protein n=1 Tax=Motilibacter rhizosphaerae TaxID=598652 RepID=A0A4Q7N772_9ACTN|nr:class I SAM-dependent methyltransferase [Motilibacter rhizosphaerae]RZS77563.1 methyltransferase family protein [Motilibacter rhizosphaerae]